MEFVQDNCWVRRRGDVRRSCDSRIRMRRRFGRVLIGRGLDRLVGLEHLEVEVDGVSAGNKDDSLHHGTPPGERRFQQSHESDESQLSRGDYIRLFELGWSRKDRFVHAHVLLGLGSRCGDVDCILQADFA